jgi:lipoprotein LpqH
MTAASISGCSSGSQERDYLSTPTARVAINGTDTGMAYPVRCSQVSWNWAIETLDKKTGFTAFVGTEQSVTAKFVQIRNLGGFTGGYWAGTVGDGKASIANGTFTITGTAEGVYADTPSDEASATFDIQTGC